MPIGIQRLNARPQPSSQIIFIKPLPGPTSAYAQDFLERIAAIAHPIMKSHHLSLTTLEEHEPNAEFIGRNFNAGEIIQLVLQAPYTGHWLGFRSVQMVMMHELAHCVQMNHGRAFWEVCGGFKAELRELWGKGYTGDGLWGRGRTLLSGEYHSGGDRGEEVLPANLCGGTFRRVRRGRRKRGKEKETYAERQQRRIRKRFGVGGQVVGDDEGTRVKLEKGKMQKGKPRIAGSKRGRELRAAAALARFEQVKEEEPKKEEESLFGDSETESDDDDDGADYENEAVDIDGSNMRDSKGRRMIKVCGDEDQDDVHVKREIEELRSLNGIESTSCSAVSPTRPNRQTPIRLQQREATTRNPTSAPLDPSQVNLYDIPQYVEPDTARPSPKPKINIKRQIKQPSSHTTTTPTQLSTSLLSKHPPPIKQNTLSTTPTPQSQEPATTTLPNHYHPPTTTSTPPPNLPCPICSLFNPPTSVVCTACSHVLDTSKVPQYWRCQSNMCKGSQYVNAGDCGICGLCGARKGDGED